VRKTLSAGRIFSTNMHEICRHLQALLTSVYNRIYGARPPGAVQFLLVPMPRLEVESIEDFKVLHEIGALTPDMTVKLSRILLGEEPGGTKNNKVDHGRGGAVTTRGLDPGEPFPEKRQVIAGAEATGKKQPFSAGSSKQSERNKP
jgi:hypothetical protein